MTTATAAAPTTKAPKAKKVDAKAAPAKAAGKGELTGKARLVLELIAKSGDGLDRETLIKKTGVKKGWSRLLGAYTGEAVRPESLIGRGLIKAQIEEGRRGALYVATAAGKKALTK